MPQDARRPAPIEVTVVESSGQSSSKSATTSVRSKSSDTSKTSSTPRSAASSRSVYSQVSQRSSASARSERTPTTGSTTRTHAESSPDERSEAEASPVEGSRRTAVRPRRTPKTERTWLHNAARVTVLYVVPIALIALLSLTLTLTRVLIEPLYNSLPLELHPIPRYAAYTILPAVIYWRSTLDTPASKAVSSRICLCIAAIAGDVVAVFGRGLASRSGRLLGGEWGATAALTVLGAGVVGGGTGFVLLCFDLFYAIPPVEKPTDKGKNFVQILLRSLCVVAHVWVAEQGWRWALRGNTSALVQHPEKSILFISALLTLLLLFIRSSPPSTPIARRVHNWAINRWKLAPKASKQLWAVLQRLPATIFPLVLLLRVPLLLLAVRQQLFLRPSPPYFAANGTLHVLHSERSLTGQIVVADELERGFRFLRCDASILGGRFHDRRSGRGAGVRLDDSIFGPFALQEVALLAHRNDESDSLARMLGLTTRLRLSSDNATAEEDITPDRALIIGLGVGIAAQAFSHQSLDIDVVEIDPVVYHSAVRYFDLNLPSSLTVNLVDGAEYVRSMARMVSSGEIESPAWRMTVQDCFTGGMVPGELFTQEFWEDLRVLMAEDGIVAMNFVGLRKSKASRAVLVTLLSVFEQCRAFGDSAEAHANLSEDDSINMIVFCTMAYSPLLTFRRPTAADIRGSLLRSHVYSTFLSYEMQLDSIIQPDDWTDPELMLRRGEQKLDEWQVPTALGTWRAMQRILTPDMWLAY